MTLRLCVAACSTLPHGVKFRVDDAARLNSIGSPMASAFATSAAFPAPGFSQTSLGCNRAI